MKRTIKASLQSLLGLLFVSTFCVGLADAQLRDSRVISARAGGINFVAGDVSARRSGESEWSRLSIKDELKGGDVVRTGQSGRVEVLLQPGSYFRAGGGSEFIFSDPSFEDLRLELSRGSAVVEATGFSDLDVWITVATPRNLIRIIRSGVYRIDVEPSGAAKVSVLKGRAVLGSMIIKGGKVAREGAAGVEVAKLNKDDRDELDVWSRDRGKELAKANEKLSNRGIRTTLAQARTSDLLRDGFSGGIWVWNGIASCYTFLPFYGYWRSPYGYSYGSYYYPQAYGAWGPGGYAPPTITRGGAPYNPPAAPAPGGGGVVGVTPGRPERVEPERSIAPPRERPMVAPHEGPRTSPAVPHRDQR